jgi:hypothetical protein
VDSGVLQVLSNRIVENVAFVCNSIELDLFCVDNELGHNNWFVCCNFGSKVQKVSELTFVRRNTHRCTREDETWSDKHGVANIFGKGNCIVLGSQQGPRRLLDSQGVQHARELTPILSTFDITSIRAQNIHARLGEVASKVVRNLSANRNDKTGRCLAFVNVQNAFETQLFKIQLVTLVIVRTHSFWVVVDNDALEPVPPELSYT